MPNNSAEGRIGSKLGPYRLTSILGQGGMGTVFRGEDTFTGREVAVKLLHATFAQDQGVAQRFIREARAAVSLRHPNVVEVLHMNQDEDGVVYMVLELLEGCSLDAHLRRRGPISLSEALKYLIPIMSALEVAHEKGIVHRDVKPENIFLSETSAGVVPKLLDFGIAKMADAVTGFATNAGAIMGSPAYMSPEQAMGSNKIGPPTDVWAMGVVIYECLTGSSPFAGGDAQKCLAKVLTADPPSLSDVADGIVKEAALLIESTLSKESPERPTMLELRSALASRMSTLPPTEEAAPTRISGVDYTSVSTTADEGFPGSPSAVELAPTDPALSRKGADLENAPLSDTQVPVAKTAAPAVRTEIVASEAVAGADVIEADGTFMPASSDPLNRPSPKGFKLGAAAVLLIGAGLGFFVVAQMRASSDEESSAREPLVAHDVASMSEPPMVEPPPMPADEPDPNVASPPASPSATFSQPEGAPAKEPAGLPTVESSARGDAVKAKSPKIPAPTQKPSAPSPAPSAEEILKKKREERINKIPSISEL